MYRLSFPEMWDRDDACHVFDADDMVLPPPRRLSLLPTHTMPLGGSAAQRIAGNPSSHSHIRTHTRERDRSTRTVRCARAAPREQVRDELQKQTPPQRSQHTTQAHTHTHTAAAAATAAAATTTTAAAAAAAVAAKAKKTSSERYLSVIFPTFSVQHNHLVPFDCTVIIAQALIVH